MKKPNQKIIQDKLFVYKEIEKLLDISPDLFTSQKLEEILDAPPFIVSNLINGRISGFTVKQLNMIHKAISKVYSLDFFA